VGEDSQVALDGTPVTGPEPRVLFALNKPVGVVSTARDTHGRRTVLELVPAAGLRLYPVGRLDIDSAGLILLTNDGELANRLTHPSFEVPKAYRAKLRGAPIRDEVLRRLRSGVQLQDGLTAPAQVRRVGGKGSSLIELTIHEGRNRQVRRMCEAVGHPVLELVRVRFGPLALDGLGPGEHRRLTQTETQRMRTLTSPPSAMGSSPAGGAL
jgi:23S rRNA pseudouridine2605 synthase